MRRQTKEQLRTICEYLQMTPAQRNKALIEEQKQKFFAKGGRVTKIQPELIESTKIDYNAVSDFLMGVI